MREVLRRLLSPFERAPVARSRQQLLAEDDRARVFHRSRREVGHGDDIELLERV
ncbi:MAG TPA: hypothetical protein VM115_07390 [Vicinamibacterales bacterium]|nr:hypothetical protein [Vicinamibacterales bacterium]